jgi:hypothetical protein
MLPFLLFCPTPVCLNTLLKASFFFEQQFCDYFNHLLYLQGLATRYIPGSNEAELTGFVR